ncbi:sensor histidine kinase [Paenibacillus koleovorans]|uniref:sensor histidine kinase n=1 Tax=Paenibacillus koleovorans TaxID=121608 RepID=UPI000FDA829F|nr:sensor histidine kinase [Paenibacillus koleovorans]
MFLPSSPLKNQLFLILILFLIVPLFIVSYFSQSSMYRASTKFVTENSELNADNGVALIESYLTQFEKTINDLSFTPPFQHFLQNLDDLAYSQQLFVFDIEKPLRISIVNKPEVVEVIFIDRSSNIYPARKNMNSIMNYSYNLLNDPVYEQVFSKNSFQLIGPHENKLVQSPKAMVVSVVKPMINYANFTIDGWFMINFDLKSIIEIVATAHSAKTNTIFLYNISNGMYIGDNNVSEAIIHKVDSLFRNNSANVESQIINIQSIDYLLTNRSLMFDDWRLVNLVSFDTLMKGTKSTRNLTYIIGAICFIVAFVLSFVFIMQILKPVYRLKHSMSLFGNGIISKVHKIPRNELGYLIQTFNQMLDERKKMEDEIVQKTIWGKEKELLQLQAQVNPHFLFNTLGTIEALADRGKKQDMADLIHEVANILRYNIRNDKGWVKLHEEIEYVQYYQNIHFYRYHRPVTIHYNVDASAHNLLIIKLGLQPFVENALKYGWNELKNAEYFAIDLRITVVDNRLHIRISDNGPGFDQQVLEHLQEMLQSPADRMIPFFSRHTGIYNTYRRFRLIYGDALTISFDNQEHSGAVVTINIPASFPDPYTEAE